MQTNYILNREDNKNARFYWFRVNKKRIKKYIGITSLASLCLPPSEQLIKWKLQKDPDGRLLQISADHGTLEHTVIHKYDTGEEWSKLIDGYQYERMVLGSLIAWKKFCEDYKVEVLASEIMLKYEKGKKEFAATLDKVVYFTKTVKEKQLVDDGFYKVGPKKGTIKLKEVTVLKEVKTLAIIDLKSNFFEKDSKTFYEEHLFQLHGQKLAFMQSFPDLGEPEIYNWSPNNWRTRSSGSLDNLYTLFQHKTDYSQEFDYHLTRAVRKGWLYPKGKIEVFLRFDKSTPINDCYKVMDYDQYIFWKEDQLAEAEKEIFNEGELENIAP